MYIYIYIYIYIYTIVITKVKHYDIRVIMLKYEFPIYLNYNNKI